MAAQRPGLTQALGGSVQEESRQSEISLGEWVQIILFFAAIGLLIFVAYLMISNREAIFQYMREAHYQPLAIATAPSGATILLDGNAIGVSPITVRTSAGAHTVTVRKEGFAEQSLAIDLENDRYERQKGEHLKLTYKAKPWTVNFKLVGAEPAPTAALSPSDASQSAIEKLQKDIAATRDLIAADPDKALSVSSLKGRVEILEQRVLAVDQKIDLSNTLKLAIWGTLLATFFALIAFLVSVLRRRAP